MCDDCPHKQARQSHPQKTLPLRTRNLYKTIHAPPEKHHIDPSGNCSCDRNSNVPVTPGEQEAEKEEAAPDVHYHCHASHDHGPLCILSRKARGLQDLD